MVKQRNANNPYHITDSAASGRLFFGRQAVFDWLLDALSSATPNHEHNQLIILHGPPRIGKTSILRQIEAGQFGEAYTAVYIDLQQVALDSVSAFFWDVTNTTIQMLSRQNIEVSLPNQTEFIADPYKAFHTKCLLPVTTTLNEVKIRPRLLFLFDNLEVILDQTESDALSSQTLNLLHNLIHKDHLATCLYTFEEKNGVTAHSLAALENERLYAIGPLVTEEALALIRQPVNYTIVKDVATYIYKICQGHPFEIQRVCHALFERQQKQNLTQLTIADVAMIKKFILNDAGHKVESKLPAYNLKRNPTLSQTDRGSIWRTRYVPISGVLIILLVVIVVALAIGNKPDTTQPLMAQMGNPPPIKPSPTLASPTSLAEVVIPTNTTTPTAQPSHTASPTQTPTPMATDTPTPSATPSPTSTPTPAAYPTRIEREQDGMPMLLIPAGTFLMGSEEGDFLAGDDERPQHEVTLSQFYIDQYEVSVEQYARFLNRIGTYSNACDHVDCAWPNTLAGYTSYLLEQDLGDGTIQYFARVGFANFPINHVSWFGADTYCQSVGARLPTEAEWEYAARGSDGRLYPWGNVAPDPTRAVFQSNSYDDLLPVDALPEGASPFGVYSMAGSLWEWTADWYDENYYQESPTVNPAGPETGFTKVIRGGAWPNNNQADRIRTANRSSLTPEFISSTVGFRCAHDP